MTQEVGNLKRDRASADVRTIKKLDRNVYPLGYVRCRKREEVSKDIWALPNITKYLLVGVRTTWNKDTQGVGEPS
jgi:hypothetical protein